MTIAKIKLLFRVISIPLPVSVNVPHGKVSEFKVGRILLERIGKDIVVVAARESHLGPNDHTEYAYVPNTDPFFGSAASFWMLLK